VAAGKAAQSISPSLRLRGFGFEDDRVIAAGVAGANELARFCRQ